MPTVPHATPSSDRAANATEELSPGGATPQPTPALPPLWRPVTVAFVPYIVTVLVALVLAVLLCCLQHRKSRRSQERREARLRARLAELQNRAGGATPQGGWLQESPPISDEQIKGLFYPVKWGDAGTTSLQHGWIVKGGELILGAPAALQPLAADGHETGTDSPGPCRPPNAFLGPINSDRVPSDPIPLEAIVRGPGLPTAVPHAAPSPSTPRNCPDLCLICLERELGPSSDVLRLPCGHGQFCYPCGVDWVRVCCNGTGAEAVVGELRGTGEPVHVRAAVVCPICRYKIGIGFDVEVAV